MLTNRAWYSLLGTALLGVGSFLWLYIANDKPRLAHVESRLALLEQQELSLLPRRVRDAEERGAAAQTALRTEVLARLGEVERALAALSAPSAPAGGPEPEDPATWARLRDEVEALRRRVEALQPSVSRHETLLAAEPWSAEVARLQATVDGARGEAQAAASRAQAAASKEALDLLARSVRALEERVARLPVASPAGPAPAPAPATPVPGSPGAASPGAVLASVRKSGVRLDLVTLRADGSHLIAELLATSEREDASISVYAPGRDRSRAVLVGGQALERGDVSFVGNQYGADQLPLLAGVSTRVRLYFECTLAGPFTCQALVVQVGHGGNPGFHADPDSYVFRNVVASGG